MPQRSFKLSYFTVYSEAVHQQFCSELFRSYGEIGRKDYEIYFRKNSFVW